MSRTTVAIIFSIIVLVFSLSYFHAHDRKAGEANGGSKTLVSRQKGINDPIVDGVAGLGTAKDQFSYVVGLEIGRSLRPMRQDFDLDVFIDAMRAVASGAQLSSIGTDAERVELIPEEKREMDAGRKRYGRKLGMDHGKNIAVMNEDLDMDILIKAMKVAMVGGKQLMTEEDSVAVENALQARVNSKRESERQRQSKKNVEQAMFFFEGNKNKKGVTTTSSGLQYEIIRQGSGKKPEMTDLVTATYTVSYLDGTGIDSSYFRADPSDFPVGSVFAGLGEALRNMSPGSRYKLWVPSKLAYGPNGQGSIQPDAALVVDVKLIAIKKVGVRP